MARSPLAKSRTSTRTSKSTGKSTGTSTSRPKLRGGADIAVTDTIAAALTRNATDVVRTSVFAAALHALAASGAPFTVDTNVYAWEPRVLLAFVTKPDEAVLTLTGAARGNGVLDGWFATPSATKEHRLVAYRTFNPAGWEDGSALARAWREALVSALRAAGYRASGAPENLLRRVATPASAFVRSSPLARSSPVRASLARSSPVRAPLARSSPLPSPSPRRASPSPSPRRASPSPSPSPSPRRASPSPSAARPRSGEFADLLATIQTQQAAKVKAKEKTKAKPKAKTPKPRAKAATTTKATTKARAKKD